VVLGAVKDDAFGIAAPPSLRGAFGVLDCSCAPRCGVVSSLERTLEVLMRLRIYSFIIETLKVVGPVIGQIAKHDVDLARQARRAASSIALNTAEGFGSVGGNERLRYRNALGSTQEVRASLDVAEALGYVDAVDAELRDRLDRIAATLYRLAT
jgi:four helix bundle protein